MTDQNPTIDELIVDHMYELQRLVKEDVEWVEAQSDLSDFGIHVTNLEGKLFRHAESMMAFRERVVEQIAIKCGQDGAETYGIELHNIRIRKRFAKFAEYFTKRIVD